jgi:hypothetical protein
VGSAYVSKCNSDVLENVPLEQPPDSWLKSFEDMINTTVICEYITPNNVTECLCKQFIALDNPLLSEQPVIATERGYDERDFDTCQIGDIVGVLFWMPYACHSASCRAAL